MVDADVQCLGLVQDGENQRRCKKRGASVMANGYCNQHQTFAIARISDLLKSLSTAPGSSRQQVQQLQKELAEAKKWCDDDVECTDRLRQLVESIRAHTSELSSNQVKAVALLERLLNHNRQGQLDGRAVVIKGERSAEGVRAADQQIRQVETAVQQATAQSRYEQQQMQKAVAGLTQDYAQAKRQVQNATDLTASLQQQLDQGMAASRNVSGAYLTRINELEQEVARFKKLYQSASGREINLGRKVKKLEADEKELADHVQELTDVYQNQEVPAGLQESELVAKEKQIESLKTQLEQAAEALRKLQQESQALNQLQTPETAADTLTLAQELQTSVKTIERQDGELQTLRTQLNERLKAFADAELKCATRIDKVTEEDRNEIRKLLQEKMNAERKVHLTEQEVQRLRTLNLNERRTHQAQILKLQDEIKKRTLGLEQARQRLQSDQQNMRLQIEARQSEQETTQRRREMEFKHLKEQLQSSHDQRLQALRSEHDLKLQQLEQERTNLRLAQSAIQESMANVRQKSAELDRFRSLYEQKTEEFNTQKNQLKVTMLEAQEKQRQYSQREAEFAQRLDLKTQELENRQKMWTKQLDDLNAKLQRLTQERDGFATNLQQCVAAREGVLHKVQDLQSENQKLKEQHLRLKNRLNVDRTMFESTIDQLRAENTQMGAKVSDLSGALTKASEAHSHTKAKAEEMERFRLEAERKITYLKGLEETIRQLTRDKEASKVELERLQNALRFCGNQRQEMERMVESTNTDVRDVRLANHELRTQVERLSRDYDRIHKSRQAELAREANEHESKEQALQQRLKDLTAARGREQQLLQKVKNERNRLGQALQSSEQERLKELALLTTTFDDPNEPPAKSTLL